MAHSVDFTKTGCTSKISQLSGFHNHLPKNLTCIFLSLRADLEKKQFALTDPVFALTVKSDSVKENTSIIIISKPDFY